MPAASASSTVAKSRDQRLLHGEHRVGVEVVAALDEHVRGDRDVAGRLDDEVHVRGPVGVALRGTQQCADRAVGGDRVVRRDDAAEPEAALVVGGEQAAAVAERLAAAGLDVVGALLVGLPDVDPRAGERVPSGEATVPSIRHGSPVPSESMCRRARAPGLATTWKGPSTVEAVASWACRAASIVSTSIDAPMHVGEQDELLTVLVALLADRGEELDALLPLGEAGAHLAQEAVQVAHEALHHLVQPGVGRVREARETASTESFSLKSIWWGLTGRDSARSSVVVRVVVGSSGSAAKRAATWWSGRTSTRRCRRSPRPRAGAAQSP